MTASRTIRLATLPVALLALLSGAVACNVVDAALGRHAHLQEMVPGQSVNGGDLHCWLTMEFDRLPEGIDHRDVVVRFESVALKRPVEFDWQYIASHDLLVPQGNQAFGSGHRRNEASTPSEPPPIGTPFKIKFKLPAKTKVDKVSGALVLSAQLIWDGEEQDSLQRTIEHVYARSEGGFF